MNLIKREIIPTDMKPIIDGVLEEQLLNANRNYAEDNKEIFELIDSFILIPPTIYLKELKERWLWHNKFYEDGLEVAYKELITSNLDELTPSQVKELIAVYNTCLNVDKVTMITSCGIKKHLDYWLDKISIVNEDYNVNDSQFMLLTPPIEPFYVQYQIDHLKYIVLTKSNDSESVKWEKYLLNQYHANDEIIFKSRFKRDFESKTELSIEELVKIINSYKISQDYKTKHYYLMLEHPYRKAFNEIIKYDNVDEKLLAFQLIGISGFLYRKKILEYLNESRILKNNGYIYEFSDKTVLEGLEKLHERSEHRMIKNVPKYTQNADTCAIVCMLSAMKYYGCISDINSKNEFSYFKKYRSRVLIGTPFSAVAYELAKNDLDVELVHSEPNIFTNKRHYLPKYLFDKGMAEYQKYIDLAKEVNVKVNNGIDIDYDFIIDQLKNNKLVMLAGNSGNYLHAILLCGYDEENIIAFDPLKGGNITLNPIALFQYMNTGIGRWCITIKQKTKEKDKLLASLETFNNQADDKIIEYARVKGKGLIRK